MLKHLHQRWPALFGLLVIFFGIFVAEHFGLYTHVPYFDKVMHILGGVAVGWMAMALFQDNLGRLPWYKKLLIITSVTCFVGVMWEYAEHFSNGFRYTYPLIYHYYHGGDLADTLGDLAADMIGGTLFSFWAIWRQRN